MGTRCLTVFMDHGQETAVLYRQHDGYLDGHGTELAAFLSGKTIVNGIPAGEDTSKMFNGMGCLIASVIAHFKKEVGEFYLYPAGTRDTGEDYTYIVSGKAGGEAVIEVEGFKGKASEFGAWLKHRLEKEEE